MFRNRVSSQKPGDELYANFRRQHFPAPLENVVVTTTTAPESEGLLDAAQTERAHSIPNTIKDLDPTPRAQQDAWRFTPSLLDPNSFAFSSFANQPPGYYTPTPGGTNTLYHSQAGDLHTPGMSLLSMGLGTPLSLPTTDVAAPTSAMLDLSTFAPTMNTQHFQNFNPFGTQPLSHIGHTGQPGLPNNSPQTFAPSTFVHRDTGYETMEQDGSPGDDDSRMEAIEPSIPTESPLMGFRADGHFDMAIDSAALPPSGAKFRFNATLNAPTAMIKHTHEIPVTYLNKGQTYSLSVVDSTGAAQPGTRYRTFVRVSFDDDQQRQKPAACWQLWKEGRGTSEAHQRGGKLQAVEFIESNGIADADDRPTKVELDTASFDGFSVIWAPGPSGAECTISVRFNFLSTDFSHSKGVKGIPVRLCAKTSVLEGDVSPSASDTAEVTFCKVKLFRDHGAERKLANDIAHVKKTIEKLKNQIAQAETGMKDFSKRKRNSLNLSKTQSIQKPGKVQKHKRTWSMSSASSAGGRVPLEEDLHFKLQTLQDMFTSTRPVSCFYLRGEELDDADLHPVTLHGEPIDITKADARDQLLWQQRSEPGAGTGQTSLDSPSPSMLSLNSQGAGTIPHTGQWHDLRASLPDQPSKIPKAEKAGEWIEVLGVDKSYQPPSDRPPKPVACFYVLYRESGKAAQPDYYRAIYLAERTMQDFILRLASKWGLDPTKIIRTLRLVAGLEVMVDDDVICELSEGQDMVMEITKINYLAEMSLKSEWDMAMENAAESGLTKAAQDVGYEIRLTF